MLRKIFLRFCQDFLGELLGHPNHFPYVVKIVSPAWEGSNVVGCKYCYTSQPCILHKRCSKINSSVILEPMFKCVCSFDLQPLILTRCQTLLLSTAKADSYFYSRSHSLFLFLRYFYFYCHMYVCFCFCFCFVFVIVFVLFLIIISIKFRKFFGGNP